MASLEIFADSAALVASLSALTELAKTRGELVEAFLNALDTPAQLVRLDLDGLPAAGAGECRILFQPSDLLVEFLAASRTGERDGL